MPGQKPTISVIIPTYNQERYIASALDSVLAQSYEDFEVIVVDDGASDRSIAICREYCDPRIRIVSQPNRGLAGARNTGIRHARGRYLAFLDADDVWMPDKLIRHLRHLESNPAIGVSYSHSAFIDQAGRQLGFYQTVGKSPTSLALLVTRNPIGNGSNAVVRAEVFDSSHPNSTGRNVDDFFFDEQLRQAEDFELWVRIATQTRWKFDCIPVPLTQYRVNADGLSSDVSAQRGYHYTALLKIYEYAPEVIAAYRTENIAYLYWYLARILLFQRDARRVRSHCRAALRFDPTTVGWFQILLMGASVLQSFLPPRLYAAAEVFGFTAFGKVQECWMWCRRPGTV